MDPRTLTVLRVALQRAVLGEESSLSSNLISLRMFAIVVVSLFSCRNLIWFWSWWYNISILLLACLFACK